MTDAKSFLKPAVVLSSVLILGGWVSYRGGAWDGHIPVEPSGGTSLGTPGSGPAAAEKPAPGQPRPEMTVFSGSKTLFVPAIPLERAGGEPEPAVASPEESRDPPPSSGLGAAP